MSIPGHEPDCIGYEDCQCFHVTLRKEEYSALLDVVEAARDMIRFKEVWGMRVASEVFLEKSLAKLDEVKR
jgi:hypothetical protein